MNMLQWSLVCALAYGMPCAVEAQEKKPDFAKLIVGTWEVEPKGGDAKAPKILIEFTKDGKVKMIFKVKGKGITTDGTYKLLGDKLETSIKGSAGVNKDTVTIIRITEKDLVTTDSDGADLRMIRVK